MLVLDMDETLIHCVKSGEQGPGDFQIQIEIDAEQIVMEINVRPGAAELLRKMSKSFQIVVFTASHKKYADAILNRLDPARKYISKRLYRDSCFEVQHDVLS